MREMQFVVEVGYKRFIFKTIEEATSFAVTARKTSVEDEDICIDVEWAAEQEEEEK
jgi:hypothetical protein